MNINNKLYEEDGELLYMVSDSNEEATETIFKKYEPVIDYYVKKYIMLVKGKGLDYNDLYQEGLIGLNSSIHDYKQQKDIKFSTFANICIRRRILTAIKNATRKKHSILNDSYPLEYQTDDGTIMLESMISSNETGIEDLLVSNENSKYFNVRIKEELTEFENEVYKLRINGFSYEEISKTLNKTIKSVESSLFRIRIKIRKILSEINWLFKFFVLLFD